MSTSAKSGYLDDYKVGDQLETPRRTITEADLIYWSALCGDWTPLHTDRVFAATTPFGERIAHGNLSLNASIGLLDRVGPSYRGEGFIDIDGWDDVAFRRPVKINDTIQVFAEVTSVEDRDDGPGLVAILIKVINQRDETVIEATERMLVARREKRLEPDPD